MVQILTFYRKYLQYCTLYSTLTQSICMITKIYAKRKQNNITDRKVITDHSVKDTFDDLYHEVYKSQI